MYCALGFCEYHLTGEVWKLFAECVLRRAFLARPKSTLTFCAVFINGDSLSYRLLHVICVCSGILDRSYDDCQLRTRTIQSDKIGSWPVNINWSVFVPCSSHISVGQWFVWHLALVANLASQVWTVKSVLWNLNRHRVQCTWLHGPMFIFALWVS